MTATQYNTRQVQLSILAWGRREKLTNSEWAKLYVRLIGSARGDTCDMDKTPWNRQPFDWVDDGFTRSLTHVKPVQCGGSALGEAALCRRIATAPGGDIQYNWEDDIKADERWVKRIERILRACRPVMQLWPAASERSKQKKGLIVFPHCNLINQGSFTDSNLDSDTIAFQINEEIHNWKPGHLQMAYDRLTAVWNSFVLNISNASIVGDQLHEAFLAGTQQYFEVPCLGCGQLHAMFTRAEKDKPGGLRYDSKGCKYPDGTYNYNLLEKTIFYECPHCKHRMRDEVEPRRLQSLLGRYSEPHNPGALLTNRSTTFQAVSVYYIPWLLLIKEKHTALKALKSGDVELWKKYRQRRECLFFDPEDRPLAGLVTLRNDIKKDRAGLPNRTLRAFSLDRQQGNLARGEFPHWWLVIRDFQPAEETKWEVPGDVSADYRSHMESEIYDDEKNQWEQIKKRNDLFVCECYCAMVADMGGHLAAPCESLLVFEGKVLTDGDVLDILKRHEVEPWQGVADSGDDTLAVYRFCMEHGINAIKGEKSEFFAHEDGTKRIFSKEKPLCEMISAQPKYPFRRGREGRMFPDVREPMFWLYSKHGIRQRLHYLRTAKQISAIADEEESQ